MSRSRGSKNQQNLTARPGRGAADRPGVCQTRRQILFAATATTGAVGIGLATLPFLSSLAPSTRAQELGAPVTVNVDQLDPGELITVIWRGSPVWVLRRTPQMLERMLHKHLIDGLADPDSSVVSQQPPYARNPFRSRRPDLFVAIGLCTHLGCIPLYQPTPGNMPFADDWMGGFFCPCHGSRFDLAGRVAKRVPAPRNLVVPPHQYTKRGSLIIGVDDQRDEMTTIASTS